MNVTGIWIGDPVGSQQSIPGSFKETWTSHSEEEYPYGNMHMLDGTHHMAYLWHRCLDLVPPDYEVIVHVRPDQNFPAGYFWNFLKSTDSMWKVNIVCQYCSRRWEPISWSSELHDQTVYMSQNAYHASRSNISTIPDDRLGFGLAKPMRDVFATLDVVADRGRYDISDAQYRTRW